MADLSIEQLLQAHPELAESFSQMSGVDPQQDQLNNQLKRAHAIRMASMTTPAYGALGGAGMGLANLFGAINENQLEGKNTNLNQQRQMTMADILRAVANRQADPMTPDAQPGAMP